MPVITWTPGKAHAAIGAGLSPTLPALGGSHSFVIRVKNDPLGLPIAVVNDILRMKVVNLAGSILDNWLKVSARVVSALYTDYTVVRQSGTPGVFPAGTAVVNYGQSGQGFLFLTSDDADGPYYSVRTHAGVPWTTQTEVGRFGNLKNSFGVGANNRYGFAAGDFSGGNYILYNPTDGFVVKAGGGALTMDANGITFTSPSAYATAISIKGVFSGTTYSDIYTVTDASTFNNTIIQSGNTTLSVPSGIALYAQDTGANTATIIFRVWNGAFNNAVSITKDNVATKMAVGMNLTANGSLNVGSLTASGSAGDITATGGLNVGSATGAATGEGRFMATDGAVRIGKDDNTGHVELHVRPNSGKSGWVSFTEAGVADRWIMGIKGGNASLWFATGFPGTSTDRIHMDSNGDLTITGVLWVGANTVVGARKTGYTAMTGSPDKATAYATSTVTLAQLAGRVAQLQADLTTHGLIGA